MTGNVSPVIVVMGVSGSGKTTVGRILATRLDGVFIDADDLHDPSSVAKMAAGTPLTDEDRGPWLDRVGAAAEAVAETGNLAVVACSALRRTYRDRIRAVVSGPVSFVELDGTPQVLTERMSSRAGHFMPAALLTSQLSTLESLAAEETGGRVSIDAAPEAIVGTIIDTVLT